MVLKNNIALKLRKYGKADNLFQIQLHVSFDGRRWITSTGCMINNIEAWDYQAQLVKEGYKGPKGETSVTINNTIRNCKEQMQAVFKYYEGNEIHPTMAQVEKRYHERITGTVPQKPPKEEKKERQTAKDLFKVFQMFVAEAGEKNAWTPATYEKMAALREDLVTFKKNLSFSDLNESGLTAFVKYLRDDKQLKTPRKKKGEREKYDAEDITGLKNSTIDKKLGYLRWFLNWATDKGYNTNVAYKTFRPTLKQTQKKVIYLTKKELANVRALEIPKEKDYLNAVRDVFLFCCFSGLRHSDVYNLRRTDIKDDHMEITTVKTADSISIELNKVTMDILAKYEAIPFPEDRALPVIKNQPMNRDLKELCKMAGVNEKIRITTYKGNQRQDQIKEKWELVGTHTGRRTFIVNALSLGIPPNVVMKWTGHSDYKSMKPYIDIVDSIKASEMTKMDSIL